MVVFTSDEKRREQRKQHKDFTFCKSCYGCIDPCGRTTVEEYREYLKESGDEDLWGMGSVVTEDREQDVHERETGDNVHSREKNKEKAE